WNIAYIRRRSVEFGASHVLQRTPLRTPSRGFVKVDRYAIAPPNLSACLMRGGDTIGHDRSIQRDERDYVSRAHAGVRALVPAKIDAFGSLSRPPYRAFDNSLRPADERHYAAVMIGIGLPPEDAHAFGRLNRLHDGGYGVPVAALREIGNTFDHVR